MNNEDKLLIFYLTNNDRYFVFKKIIDEINNCNYKNNIFLLIVNTNNDSSFYNEYLSQYQISNETVCVDCPVYDYLPKVRFAINYATNNNFKYIMKCDNDVLIPSYTIDCIVENLEELNKTNILT